MIPAEARTITAATQQLAARLTGASRQQRLHVAEIAGELAEGLWALRERAIELPTTGGTTNE